MDREPARRVAVIAVHGVGHHEPREAARAAADLLATSTPTSYSPFVESPLRIPVARLEVGAEPQRQHGLMHAFDERASFLRQAHESHTPAPSPELEYMREQLSGYEPTGSDLVYDTIMVSGTRTDPQDGRKVEVHVFDMYWTDLSRVSTAGVRFIGELYQLLFYVCGLGRKTLDFACAAYGNGRAWKALAFCQRHAERLLVLYIPVLNLCAIGLGVIVIPQRLYELESPLAISTATSAILILLALGTTVLMKRFRAGRWWPAFFWVVLAIAAVLGQLLPRVAGPNMPLALAEGCWIIVSAAIVAVMSIYDRRRPGARLVGILSVILVAVMLLCPIITRDIDERNVQEIALRTGKWLYVILHWLWLAFIGLAVLVSALGFLAPLRSRGNAVEYAEARRCAWTANLSLALPGLLVLLLNLALWRGGLKLAGGFLDPSTVQKITGLLDESTPWSFVALMALAALAFVSVVWSLLPSVIGERFPREAAKADPALLGAELSEGFVSMRAAGEAVRWIVVLGLPATYVLQPWIPRDVVEWLAPISQDSTLWIGLALVAMVAGPGPLRALALGLRTAIDIAIDVANWLRLHPLNENPRARICARFSSLLHHILGYRSADRRGFDSIVIFAHSQGTVISSELLRFLRLESHPLSQALSHIPVRLFTMGCPLRQLYSQRFPHQYGWARHANAKWPGAKPDPEQLGVAAWVNAYRSGDYVGRYLWHPDGTAVAWSQDLFQEGKREELCIGAGAHTHYWDDTAPTIAAKLDELVCRQ